MMPSTIDRSKLEPYYYQVYQVLHQKIARNEWAPGHMLPPEKELQEQFGVSRATVRQALDMLVSEGLITRHRGRGSFVAEPAIEHGISRIISFTDDMRNRELEPSTRLLAGRLVDAPVDIAQQLDINPGDELAHIERLRLADGNPMSLENSYLIHRYCAGILEHYDGSQSLRKLLETGFNLRLVYARQKVRAVNAERKVASLLDIEPGAAVLYIERITHDELNRPVELLKMFHRGDRYILYNELRDS